MATAAPERGRSLSRLARDRWHRWPRWTCSADCKFPPRRWLPCRWHAGGPGRRSPEYFRRGAAPAGVPAAPGQAIDGANICVAASKTAACFSVQSSLLVAGSSASHSLQPDVGTLGVPPVMRTCWPDSVAVAASIPPSGSGHQPCRRSRWEKQASPLGRSAPRWADWGSRCCTSELMPPREADGWCLAACCPGQNLRSPAPGPS